jgi:hypothetical protein
MMTALHASPVGPHVAASARYALYFAPAPDTVWHRLGSAWLGRDAYRDLSVSTPGPRAPEPSWLREVTRVPRHYGWHATLKAPFRLAAGTTLADLERELEGYCGAQHAFQLPHMDVRRLGDFLALVPVGTHAPTERIAAECVQRFDRYRAPPSAEEIARRLAGRLDFVERGLLERWGEPFVLERFRFHFTLTGPLSGGDDRLVPALLDHACEHFRDVRRTPLSFDAITLFEQPAPERPFTVRTRVQFGR